MGLISLLWGIVALCWMVLALIPVIGITNWLLIPFAAVGALIAAIGIMFTRSENRGRAKAGLILNGIVIVVAAIRLSMGGGLPSHEDKARSPTVPARVPCSAIRLQLRKQMRCRHMQIKHDRFPAIAAPATVASPRQVSP
jgi:hypothetical protein